jgi:hypothetical protein
MIDTSSTPAKKEATEEKTDGQGLTENDKIEIERLMDEKLLAELQAIYTKIIEKAEFSD